MKPARLTLLGLIILLLVTFKVGNAQTLGDDREEKIKNIHLVLGMYAKEILLKTGLRLDLRFNPSMVMQATGGIVDGKPEMTFYEGIIKNLSSDSLVLVTCHELGHILGGVSFRSLGVLRPRIMDDSVEGEADYFAGKCLLLFFKDSQDAKNVGQAGYESIYKRKIDWRLAESQVYSGVSTEYPSDSCRVLSMRRGVEGSERPKCWYNPPPPGAER